MEVKAELVMAVRGYDFEGRESWDGGMDFTASDAESDEKILLRVITDPKSNSGTVGVDAVRQMVETIKREDYDEGVMIGERFSKAARKEIDRKGFQMISERFTPPFKPQKLYLAIQECAEDLCKARCGRVPEKESDCKGKDAEGGYSCRIRLIGDNASFHFQRSWTNLLREDLKQLLTLRKSMNHQNDGDNSNV